MSRLRAPSPSPLRQLSKTPTPSHYQEPTTPIIRRVTSMLPSPISSDRRFVAEEKHQEVVRLNGEYENHLRRFKDLLEDTRKKWNRSEEENARLTAINEELQRQLEKALASNTALKNQLSKAGAMDLKKLEEDTKKPANAFNKADFTRSNYEETSSSKPEKKKNMIHRSFSAVASRFRSGSNAPSSSATSSPSSYVFDASLPVGTSSTYDYLDKVNSRCHTFGPPKRYFDNTRCHACSKKILTGFDSMKCTVCQTVCHPNCRKDAPPCVPFFEPPNILNGSLTLDEYCCNVPPKLPHLIVRCVQYLNGKTSYKGLYIDCSQDAKAESLLELLLHDPSVLNLKKFGPKVAAQCILKFLASLKQPLIPDDVELLKASLLPGDNQLERVLTNLPVVHKNVLAVLILHWKLLLQEGSGNGLTEESLGNAILPIIMRIPTSDAEIYSSVFHRLLSLPSWFWCSAIDAAPLRCPFEENDDILYAHGAQKKQEQFGRFWG